MDITKITLFVIILLTSSCATTARFEETYNTWVGMTSVELVAAMGKPNEIIKLPDGTTEYSYNLSISKRKPLPNTCILNFILDTGGVITGIKHEGNLCKRAPSFA